MKNSIAVKQGTYEYEDVSFQPGRKYLDLDNAKNNLLSLKNIFDAERIAFGLIYGTLLGAIRENNFIEHDEDIDLFVLEENKQKVLDALFALREKGFEVGRYDGELLSLCKDDEYIDLYFFKSYWAKRRVCARFTIKSRFLMNTEDYQFLGATFQVPRNPKQLLKELYGKTWDIPIKGKSAGDYSYFFKLRKIVKKYAPLLYKDFWLPFRKNKV